MILLGTAGTAPAQSDQDPEREAREELERLKLIHETLDGLSTEMPEPIEEIVDRPGTFGHGPASRDEPVSSITSE